MNTTQLQADYLIDRIRTLNYTYNPYCRLQIRRNKDRYTLTDYGKPLLNGTHTVMCYYLDELERLLKIAKETAE